MSASYLPLFLKGKVVKGFGRGSKDLGCPTANYPREVAQSLPHDFQPGVYYGWAQVDDEVVRKMVVNIGWCPFYQNKEMTVETHVLHTYDSDFYDSILKIGIVGYLRPEMNFTCLEEMVTTIKNDIENAKQHLEEEHSAKIKSHSFFTDNLIGKM